MNFLRGLCMRLYLSPGIGRDRLGIETFSIVCVSNVQTYYSSILCLLRPHHSRNFFKLFYSLSSFRCLLLTASGLSSYQHILRIRLTVMESPLRLFLLPYLQNCDGTVCPDHVGLCIILTQIYPTMTNPPISIRSDATSTRTDNSSVRTRFK